MGYLTNRGYLRDLEELREHLPEGWTFNTPCRISYQELEDFREVSHSNGLFKEMLATGKSIHQVFNGPGWEPCGAEILREQKISALAWAEALDDELGGLYSHHPHQSGAYVHTMWARANDRDEAAQAIFVVDMSSSDEEFKGRFCNWVRDMARRQESWDMSESNTWQHGGCQGGGVARGIDLATQGLFASTTDRRMWRRGRGKAKGTTLADKRRGIAHAQAVKSCKAVWR